MDRRAGDCVGSSGDSEQLLAKRAPSATASAATARDDGDSEKCLTGSSGYELRTRASAAFAGSMREPAHAGKTTSDGHSRPADPNVLARAPRYNANARLMRATIARIDSAFPLLSRPDITSAESSF